MSEAPSSSAAKWLMLLLGFVVGGASAGGVFFFLLKDRDRHWEEELHRLKDPANVMNILDKVPGMGERKAGGNQTQSDEARVAELGKEFVADLENSRFAAAYRTTTPNYQRMFERKVFDEMVSKYPGLHRMNNFNRDMKARKAADGKGFEFYFTGRDILKQGTPEDRVNVALIFSQEAGEWRVNEVEITAAGK